MQLLFASPLRHASSLGRRRPPSGAMTSALDPQLLLMCAQSTDNPKIEIVNAGDLRHSIGRCPQTECQTSRRVAFRACSVGIDNQKSVFLVVHNQKSIRHTVTSTIAGRIDLDRHDPIEPIRDDRTKFGPTVRRGAAPGIGLWRLIGGFLN